MEAQCLHVLIYDEDHLAQSILQEFAPVFNFSFEIETDLEKVRKKITENEWGALLIIEKGTSESIFAFLASLNPQHTFKIAYFTQLSSDARSFRKLKQELHVDYVLQQPLDKNEFAAILRHLSVQKEVLEPQKEYLTPELLEKYKEKIFEKIERIEELINTASSATDFKAVLLEIRNEIHKITGNAAPYGYPEAGKLCGAHEIYLYELYSGSNTYEAHEVIGNNELFLRKLKLYFQKILPRAERKIEVESHHEGLTDWQRRATDQKIENIHIHLITTDFDLARYFQSAAVKIHINLTIEDNPDTYLKNFASLATVPHIILVDEHFPFLKWNGIDLIKSIQAQHVTKETLFGLLTDLENLDKRMEWRKEGVDLILKKPITDANIEYILTHAFKKRELPQARILILDDDEAQGLLMKNLFESAHLSAVYLQDEDKLFSTLEEFSPDLLILDIMMPKYSGKLLLGALREDIRYKNLLIVIVTALSSSEVDEWAYTEKCDSVMHKPLDIPIFMASVLRLLEKQRKFFSSQDLDPMTGLLRWEPFLQQAEDFLSQCPKGMKCAFALLKIDQWQNLRGLLNSHERQQILLLFSSLLKSHFFSTQFKGLAPDGGFAFLFKDITGGEIEFLMDSFYEKIGSKIWISSQTHLKITASTAAILFFTGEVTLQQALEEAPSTLKKAQEEGPSRIEIRRIGEKISMPTAVRRIILVDDDTDLCDIIQFTFEKHGFVTKAFHNATDALHFFAQLQTLEDNTLLILDRQLPDGDGIDVLRKIRDKFPGVIKVIFLSSLTTEKEILESLRAGALDYVTKPFSAEVLIEKASILLSK